MDLRTKPSFSVCALVREKPEILERFARYYLALGAERVRFYFDGEAREAIVPDLPGVEVTVCDRDYWQARLGRQPGSMRDTHDVIFRDAHDSATSEWQLFCDADEFLVCDMGVREMLARVPDECEALRIMNVEAVWGPGDDIGAPFGCTYFRLPLSPLKQKFVRVLLPFRRRDLLSERGFAGHFFGKHFLRRGTVVDRYDCHRSFRNEVSIAPWAYDLGFDFRGLFIVHFDAISEARWREKWRRRVSSERPAAALGDRRVALAEALSRAETNGTTRRLFRQVYGVSRYEAAVLSLAKVLMRRRLFPPESPG